jgi:putative Mn2+ efflux pump MntP
MRAVTFGAILFLALGLAMDAAAVSAARGVAAHRIGARQITLVALLFGGFQALMPLIGWHIGARVGPLVEAWDHWVAFGLLATLGARMLWEARTGHPHERESSLHPALSRADDVFGLRIMLVLAIATSIDALAAGITLPLLGAPLVLSLVTIGATTAALSVLGLFAGRRFGAALGRRLDIVGGLMLIGIGTRILIEHLSGT